MSQSAASAWKIIPEFQSVSILKTIEFYTMDLHFILGGSHTDEDSESEPTFCSLFKGSKAAANIYFRKCLPGDFRPGRAWIAMGTTALEELYGELVEGGSVEVVEKIANMEWGYRQFGIKDCDGNVITFFRFLEGGNPGDEIGKDTEK